MADTQRIGHKHPWAVCRRIQDAGTLQESVDIAGVDRSQRALSLP